VCHQALQTTAAQAVTNATALANLLKVLQANDTLYTSVDFAEAGSDVFNPAGTLSIAGTQPIASTPAARPLYYNFAGRGVSGRKTRLFVFGIPAGIENNWRYTTAEAASVNTVVNGLNAQTGSLALIDGSVGITWKPYANVGANDRYVKRIRRTG